MSGDLNLTTVGLFLLVVFPGLISTTVYRLTMPARTLEWGSALLQGLFYSAVNFVLGMPILFALVVGYEPLQHPVRYSIAAALLLVVMPALWPLVLVRLFKSRWLEPFVQIPYPTAWDYFFNQPEPAFLLVHLSSGALLGGYWGRKSYAGSFPNDGDIYLEAVCRVDAFGRLGGPMPDTRGVLLRKDQYSYIELFSVPKVEVAGDGEG